MTESAQASPAGETRANPDFTSDWVTHIPDQLYRVMITSPEVGMINATMQVDGAGERTIDVSKVKASEAGKGYGETLLRELELEGMARNVVSYRGMTGSRESLSAYASVFGVSALDITTPNSDKPISFDMALQNPDEIYVVTARPEYPDLPGGPIAEWMQYEPRVDQETMEEFGIKNPEGRFFPFLEGERVAFIKGDHGRDVFILTAEGKYLPFDDWAKTFAPDSDQATGVHGRHFDAEDVLRVRPKEATPKTEPEPTSEPEPIWTFDSKKNKIISPDGRALGTYDLTFDELRAAALAARDTAPGHGEQWPTEIA